MIDYEIERKFLVKVKNNVLDDQNFKQIRQSYLIANKYISLRARIETYKELVNDSYKVVKQEPILMFKIRTPFSGQIEVGLQGSQIPGFILNRFEKLFFKTGKYISKNRITLGKWEFDIFETPNQLHLLFKQQNLILAEIELVDKNETLPELPAGLEIVKEVTDDPVYINANMYKTYC